MISWPGAEIPAVSRLCRLNCHVLARFPAATATATAIIIVVVFISTARALAARAMCAVHSEICAVLCVRSIYRQLAPAHCGALR